MSEENIAPEQQAEERILSHGHGKYGGRELSHRDGDDFYMYDNEGNRYRKGIGGHWYIYDYGDQFWNNSFIGKMLSSMTGVKGDEIAEEASKEQAAADKKQAEILEQQLAQQKEQFEAEMAQKEKELQALLDQQSKDYSLALETYNYNKELNALKMEREDSAYARAVKDARNAGLSAFSVTGASADAGTPLTAVEGSTGMANAFNTANMSMAYENQMAMNAQYAQNALSANDTSMQRNMQVLALKQDAVARQKEFISSMFKFGSGALDKVKAFTELNNANKGLKLEEKRITLEEAKQSLAEKQFDLDSVVKTIQSSTTLHEDQRKEAMAVIERTKAELENIALDIENQMASWASGDFIETYKKLKQTDFANNVHKGASEAVQAEYDRKIKYWESEDAYNNYLFQQELRATQLVQYSSQIALMNAQEKKALSDKLLDWVKFGTNTVFEFGKSFKVQDKGLASYILNILK